jgi:adenine-specific DNA-methyltransferase
MKPETIEHRRSRQDDLGQFLTAKPVADFMASMLGPLPRTVRLLDAGAGTGSLTLAFVSRCCEKPGAVRAIEATLYELDPEILGSLSATMRECERRCSEAGVRFTFTIHATDFIRDDVGTHWRCSFRNATTFLRCRHRESPYRKINTGSAERHALRSIGIETSNLYAGFIALIHRLLAPAGNSSASRHAAFATALTFARFVKIF